MLRFTLASLSCLLSTVSGIYLSCLLWGWILSTPLPFALLCLIYFGSMASGVRTFARVWTAGR